MSTRNFHRYLPTKGYNLYWIIIAYLIVGYFYPVIGSLALVCMIARAACAGVFRMGRLGSHRARLLDDNTYDNDCRRHTFLHICPTHMVFVLSDGHIVLMGLA